MGTRFRSCVVAICVLVLASAARAQSVHEIVAGGDTVTGSVDSAADVDRIPFRLVEGALVTLSVKAAKGSTLLPQVTILGTDRTPDPLLGGALVTATKGNQAGFKKLLIGETGLRWLEVRGAGGSTGAWIVAFKVKLPKGAVVAGTAAAAGDVDLGFINPGDATAKLTVAADKGSLAIPSFVSLRDSKAAVVSVGEVVPGTRGFQAVDVYMPTPGSHVLRVAAPAAGGLTLKAKWKVPKPFKRTLLEDQVITDPILLSSSPAGGDTSQVVAMSLQGDFLELGVKATFKKPPILVTVQGSAVTLVPGGITFNVNLQPFQSGIYDLEVENADGGKSALPQAFVVVNAAARPISIDPASGFDNEVKRITVTGTFLHSGAAVTLERGGDSIPGTAKTGAGTTLSADFDLRDRAHGLWDVVVINPDAAEARLTAVFEIVNAPPVLSSITPDHNLDGAVVACTLLGTAFDAVPSVALRKSGQPDIAGSSVVRVTGDEVAATFNTTGAVLGAWDVVLTNPDGQSSSLPAEFRVSGSVAPAAKTLTAGGEAHGPVSVVYNGTRDEFVAAWVDEAMGNWTVFAQRLDADGTPLGSAATVASATTVAKKEAVVAFDKDHDELLVAWAEPVAVNGLSNPGKGNHPSAGYSSLHQIFARRLKGSDLSTLGSTVALIDGTTDFPTASGWYIEDFHNFRPTVLWDPKAGVWTVGWTQEWDTSGSYSTDDYDVMYRTVDRAGVLGGITGVASGSLHDGDLELAWDPVGERVLTAYNTRPSTGAPLALQLGVAGGGAAAATDSSADLGDPRIAVDAASKRILVTWTRRPTSGNKSVQAATFSLDSPSNRIGNVLTVGSGSLEDHLHASPLFNAVLGEGMIAWTRIDGSGDLSVRLRRTSTSGATGLVLLGTEIESSGGTGDEGAPTAVVGTAAGESVIFWLKTLTFTSSTNYTGSVTGGTWRGAELWIHRYQ